MSTEQGAPVPERLAERAEVRDCGHAECQEVLEELRVYGRRLTPSERAAAKGEQ